MYSKTLVFQQYMYNLKIFNINRENFLTVHYLSLLMRNNIHGIYNSGTDFNSWLKFDDVLIANVIPLLQSVGITM